MLLSATVEISSQCHHMNSMQSGGITVLQTEFWMLRVVFSGLSHEQNMAKMRLLTFMGMAVEMKEILFDTMQQELQIGAEDVEAFVIDGM